MLDAWFIDCVVPVFVGSFPQPYVPSLTYTEAKQRTHSLDGDRFIVVGSVCAHMWGS